MHDQDVTGRIGCIKHPFALEGLSKDAWLSRQQREVIIHINVVFFFINNEI
jgi:hypothetical protein